jgi:predicted cupin superfamily sugar epimerase
MGRQFTAEEIIRCYDLRAHPEGGYFRESYRSEELISRDCLPSRYTGARHFSTAIYYLLPQGSVSRLHRIASDEIWHFYMGGRLTIVEFRPDRSCNQVALGPDIDCGERLQHVVPAGTWFGAYPNAGSDYSFVGCTVAPGFDFADFALASRHELFQCYPQEEELILRLTSE